LNSFSKPWMADKGGAVPKSDMDGTLT